MDAEMLAMLTDAERAMLERAEGWQEGGGTGSLSVLRQMQFRDPLGHPLENCVEFQAIADDAQARTDVPMLCATVARLRAYMGLVQCDRDSLDAALAEARRELEALREDREALHWLDEHTGSSYSGWVVRLPTYSPAENGVEVWKPLNLGPHARLGMSIRQAIAAAMREEEGRR